MRRGLISTDRILCLVIWAFLAPIIITSIIDLAEHGVPETYDWLLVSGLGCIMFSAIAGLVMVWKRNK